MHSIKIASTDDQLEHTIQTGRLQPPRTVSGVPPAVVPVLDRALATDPADRYDTAEAFYAALREQL